MLLGLFTKVIELAQVYRRRDNDPDEQRFFALLDEVRMLNPTDAGYETIRTRFPSFAAAIAPPAASSGATAPGCRRSCQCRGS